MSVSGSSPSTVLPACFRQRCCAVSTASESQRARIWKLLRKNGKRRIKKDGAEQVSRAGKQKSCDLDAFFLDLHLILNVVVS